MLKAKYFPFGSLFSNVKCIGSTIWASILKALNLIHDGFNLRLEMGNTILHLDGLRRNFSEQYLF